jgi:lysophospholipase L1-like esterase
VLQLLASSKTYPGQLEMMLKARYTAQTQQIVVVNRGIQREQATDGARRLPSELSANTPDVLLLLEGVNDLNTGNPAASMSAALAALRAMIIQARGNSVRVMVGTLLPERADGYNSGAINLIVPFNSQLVPMASAEGALVVDLYDAFLPHLSDWIGVDGLHPNEAGYQAMAQVFFTAIRASYETAGSSMPTRGTPFRTSPLRTTLLRTTPLSASALRTSPQ